MAYFWYSFICSVGFPISLLLAPSGGGEPLPDSTWVPIIVRAQDAKVTQVAQPEGLNALKPNEW